MTATDTRDSRTETGTSRLFRAIGAIERAGNKLPHPFWLFWILAGVLSVVSLVLAGFDVSVTLPESGDHVAVKSLLSLDGVTFAASSALDNLAAFPPLAVILVMLFGVSVAEKSGLLGALLRTTVVRLPGRWVTFAIAFAGMIAHVMSDSAYLVMIPLGALAFRAAGRSPVLGVMVAYVAVSAGFNASPLVTPSDAIRSSLSATAAKTVDPDYVVTPVATYFFSAASSLLLAVVITWVVERVLARRPEFARSPDEDLSHEATRAEGTRAQDTRAEATRAEDTPTDAAGTGTPGSEQAATLDIRLTPTERRALQRAGGILVLYAGAVMAMMSIPDSPLLGENGSIVNSVVVVNISIFIALLFALLGFVYGRTVGTIPSLSAVPGVMAEGVSKIAPVVVLFFAVSQFLAYFKWTGIGSVLTVKGAAVLHSLDAPLLLVLLAILLAVGLLNMLITSGSAMWAILAPILVPMMMYLGIRPEAAQAAFMIGDSITNAVTPMSPYFVLALGFVQQYRKNAGIGTLMSFTVPIAVAILIAWSAFFALWYALGLPLGPGVPLR